MEYTLIGKVYGEEVRQIPPYDVTKRAMIASYLTMDEKPFQGWLTDSTGTFKIEHLKRGKYQLVAQFVGLNSCDTLVTIPFQSDTLRITLPLWYEYIENMIVHRPCLVNT